MDEHRRELKTESDREERLREEGLEEVGRKGGSASMAHPGLPATASRVESVPFTRDLVRWSSIWAGLLIALPIQLILSAIGLAVALRTYDPASANYGASVGSMVGTWSAISFLIALFVGGYIAGRMAATSGTRNGVLQGTVVWAIAVLFIGWLGATGAGGFLSSAFANPNVTSSVARTGVDISNARAMALSGSNAAWYFVLGSVLSWVTAAVGGSLGSAARYEEVREEGHAR